VPSLPAKSLADRVSIRSLADIRPAAEALHEIALSLGRLRTAACANIASKEPMVDGQGQVLATEVFGWGAQGPRWWENSRLALTSPLTIACRYESEPFWCNEDGIHLRQNNPHIAALDLADFCKRAMTEAAIVIPIHLPFGQIAAVSFNPIEPERVDLSAEFAEHSDTLDLVARRFICGYDKVMAKHRWIKPDVRLSKREVECLRWAALGKTDDEIARILARSCATVRFHIHNAAIKLNSVNRSQTVFKASQLGYLGLDT
jgi:LuxR family transcriptional regulator, quorum-sensing system regulator CciR